MHGNDYKSSPKPAEKDAHADAPRGATSSAGTRTSPTPAARPAHNFLALGGCLAGGAGVSAVAMHFLGARKA
jgi:predicted lipid-binding transport protein (Tim44 family)